MAKKTGGGAVYIATDSGSAEIKGETLVFSKGATLVREGHPLLKACPDFFELASDHVHYDVEQATAAPGEKRGG